jgi:hypothetical protein
MKTVNSIIHLTSEKADIKPIKIMEVLLISGSTNVGKTGRIRRVAKNYLSTLDGFAFIEGVIPDTQKPITAIPETGDFCVLVTVKGKRVLINTPSDQRKQADLLKAFYKKHAQMGVDVLISSVRCKTYKAREDFFTTMSGILPSAEHIIEVPLAKIIRGNSNLPKLDWYKRHIEKLLVHILQNDPFYL